MSGIDDRKVGLKLDLATVSRANALSRRASPSSRSTVPAPRSVGSMLVRAGGGLRSGAASVVRTTFGGLIRSFLICVIVPTMVAAIYFGIIASKEYMAESRFVVRGNMEKNPGSASVPFGGLLAGLSSSSQDSYVLSEHIRSSDMVERLQATLNFTQLYGRPEADFWARLDPASRKEEVLRYWNTMSRVSVENLSGIVTLRVWAFTPQDALRISGEVIRESEDLTNRITQRGRDDSMRFARSEVVRAEERVAKALVRLKQVKDANGIIDPELQIKDTLTLLTTLKSAKVELEIRLQAAGGTMRPDSPVVRDLLSQKRALDGQIAEIEGSLTRGRNAGPAVPPAAGGRAPIIASDALREFEEVEVERQFAEKAYAATQAALDVARQQANAQQIYVTVFSPPTLPQDAYYPRPVALTLVTFACAFGFWLIGALGTAAVNDHRL